MKRRPLDCRFVRQAFSKVSKHSVSVAAKESSALGSGGDQRRHPRRTGEIRVLAIAVAGPTLVTFEDVHLAV
jgi:hypothetical protein